MAMLNPTQFDTDSLWKRMKFHYRRGQGRLWAYFVNRMQFNYLCKLYVNSKFPPHLDIEPTMLCNMKCPMCFQQHMPIPKDGYLDFELYKKIINEAAANNLYSVRLCHRGEPLLHPKIVEMVRYAKEKGIKEVFTLTNGLALNERMIRGLLDAGLDWIQLSIDGIGETYEKIRQPAKFDDVYAKVKMLHKLRTEQKRLRPIIWIQTIWSAIKDNQREFIDHFEPYVDKIAYHIDFDYEHRFEPDPNFVCYRLWHRMMVMADGSVPMCNSDFLKEELLGNVKEKSIKELWNCEKMKRIRQMHADKKRFEIPLCKKCNWGNSKVEKEAVVDGKRQTILANIPQEKFRQELKDIQFGD